MAGTTAGGQRAAATNKEKYGEGFYQSIGALGGKAKVPKGFALNKELARTAGAKGGSISRRGKAEPKPEPRKSLIKTLMEKINV